MYLRSINLCSPVDISEAVNGKGVMDEKEKRGGPS